MIISKLVYVFMPISIYLAFMWAPPAEILGEASRVVYFHVPCSWVATLAFIMSGVISIIYLYDKKDRFSHLDERAYNSAKLGMLFTVLAIISGSIWAKISWGSYWNWDPRESSIVILLLIYLAYFSLRTALADNPNKGRLTSVYLIFAMVAVPFVVFVIPRVYPSLHPDTLINPERKVNMDQTMRIALLFTTISFTLLYLYIFSLTNRLSRIMFRIEEKYHEE